MQNIAELYKKTPMKNRHHHHHLLATYAKSYGAKFKYVKQYKRTPGYRIGT